MDIKVHIERLTLDGAAIPHHQFPLLQAAFEAELGRLLAANGLSPGLLAGGAVYRVPAGTIQLSSENNPSVLGQQIAQAVYGGIGQ